MGKQASTNSKLQLEIDSVFTDVAYVQSIDGPDDEDQVFDATDLASADIEDGEPTGQRKPGTVSSTIFYDADAVTHIALLEARGVKSNWKIILPSTDAIAFTGVLRKFKPKATVGDGLMADIEIKLSTPATFPNLS